MCPGRLATLVFGLCSLLVLPMGPAAAHADLSPLHQTPGEDPASTTIPFSDGEQLFYRVEWDPPWFLFFLPKMEAGELELALSADADYQQKPAWRIMFRARSSGTLSKLAGLHVDDYFESVADRVTLCTYSVKKRIEEGKRKREIDVTYFPGAGRLHIRDLDVARVPPRIVKDKDKEGIPACVKDVFAALYALRLEKLEAGSARQWVIGDDDVVKEIETRGIRIEIVPGPKGPAASLRIETVALFGGLFKEGGHFTIWLSHDARKLPLKFDVQVRLGRVNGRLVSVKGR